MCLGRGRKKERGAWLTPQEARPLAGRAEVEERRVRAALALAHALREVAAGERKNQQADDLPGQAGDHDVDARLRLGGIVAGVGGRDAAAGALQDEGDEIVNMKHME